MHQGYSPQDDSESRALLIRVGFPFLSIVPARAPFFRPYGRPPPGVCRGQMSVATKVYQRAHSTASDLTYCLRSFGHLVKWRLRGNFSPYWAAYAEDHADQSGGKFDTAHGEKEQIERLFGAYWNFDCPICDYVESAVAELNEPALEAANIVPMRMVCVNCGFTVGKTHLLLSEVLLEAQIAKSAEQILSEYGIRG